MSDTPQTAANSRHSGFGTFAWVLGLLLAVHVLSAGPATVLQERAIVSEKAILVVYAPLIWLCEHCEPVEKFLDWYYATFWERFA